ncbi:hypothetical protein JX265_009302 [Neoarthrinium moseri]|uniref:Uncharacterized protein n=1 Tax=Neoarthrinium moseri TaxID=1658444 RepID=A0A9P9WGD2_9PEZI|nr:hypothetical protein JX265_009302 [Neoarthrinium moseri]
MPRRSSSHRSSSYVRPMTVDWQSPGRVASGGREYYYGGYNPNSFRPSDVVMDAMRLNQRQSDSARRVRPRDVTRWAENSSRFWR